MATTKPRTHKDWIDRDVHDAKGEKIGKVTAIYADDRTGRPDWMTVATGWLGSSEHFVPIAGTKLHGDELRIGHTKDKVKDAPTIDVDEDLDADEERRLYRHYGLDYARANATTEVDRADAGFGYKSDRDADVLRSEEELDLDESQRESGRLRLRKYTVSEDVNFTVPLKKRERVETGREGTKR